MTLSRNTSTVVRTLVPEYFHTVSWSIAADPKTTLDEINKIILHYVDISAKKQKKKKSLFNSCFRLRQFYYKNFYRSIAGSEESENRDFFGTSVQGGQPPRGHIIFKNTVFTTSKCPKW